MFHGYKGEDEMDWNKLNGDSTTIFHDILMDLDMNVMRLNLMSMVSCDLMFGSCFTVGFVVGKATTNGIAKNTCN